MDVCDLDVIFYDFEVFAHDWMVCFKNYSTGNYDIFWNDNQAVSEFMDKHEDSVFIGYNTKWYDRHILHAVVIDCTPEEVKRVNDFIIEGSEPGWKAPYIKDKYFYFNNCDLMDDVQMGTSLKSIEGHLGMSIEETSVEFDIRSELTEEQKREVEKYCKHDVDATEKLFEVRHDYLQTKIDLAKLGNIDPIKALAMTDPKLAAAFMGAVRYEFNDEREYEFPDRLDYSLIPTEIIEFFKKIWDNGISDEELFGSKLETVIGGCPVTIGWGGIHGALTNYKEIAKGVVKDGAIDS